MQARPNLEAAMLQSSLDCIIAIDQDGRILEFNPAAERTFGWRRSDVLGREMAELLVPQSLRERHREGLARYRLTGQGRLLDRRLEMTALRADGTEFPVELTITRVAGEGPAVFTGVLRDITDRKRAERRRATELAITRVMAEASTTEGGMHGILRSVAETLAWDVGAVWMVDPAADVLRCMAFLNSRPTPVTAFEQETRARTFTREIGLPGRVWASGRPTWIADVVSDTNFPRAPRAAAENLRGAFGFPVLLRGEVVGVVEFFSERIEEPDPDLLATMGSIGGQLGLFLERTRAEAELREADNRKDRFLAMLAHELRNPLAPISSAAAILQHAASDTAVVEHARGIIDRQLALLMRLVEDLLDMSRLTLNKVELRRSRVSLAAVIQRGVEANATLAESSRQTLTVNTEPVWLYADPERMVQVVANLVNNAIKFTPPGGHIWVSGTSDGEDAVITVRDNGVGIAADMTARVFDPFVQVASAPHARSGLGIGLTVVRDLVHMHGGRVSVESAGRDLGTAFVVRLPIVPAQVEADSTPSFTVPSSPRPRRRILVVDDHQDAADSLGLLLTLMGHDVRTAHDGPSALKVAREYQPDTALLDVGLPGMDGLEVARAIRRLPAGREVLLVAVTGWGQEEDRRRSAEAGFDHHLVKPVDPKILEKLLAGLDVVS